MFWLWRRSRREQRDIAYLMRDFRPRTGRAVLIMLAGAAALWGLAVLLTRWA